MFERFSVDPNPEALSLPEYHPEDAAGQELPIDAADGRVSLFGLCRRSLLGNTFATVKSAEIFMAGIRVHNAAAFALVLTALDDGFALYRARQSCRSTVALLAVERDHMVHMAGEAVRRMGLMARITREVGEEAAYPVRVRFELALENLRRTVFF